MDRYSEPGLSLRALEEMEQSILRELGEDRIKRKVLIFSMEYDLLTGSQMAPALMERMERQGIKMRELTDLMCSCQDELIIKAFS